MSQLGSGSGSGYPSSIDTRQIYRNGVNPAPDSDVRVDAEALNDILTAIVQIETALGAGVNGAFASLAARLAALLSQVDAGGVPGVSNVVPFSVPMSVTIPGAAHSQDVAALLVQLYDLATPRQALQAADVTIAPLTFDVTIFFATGQSGVAIVAAPAPYFITSFTTTGSPPTATVLGTAHGLSEPYLHFQAWDSQVPAHAVEVQTFQVEPSTRNVTLTTGTEVTGTLFLSAGTPRYTQTFAAALSWSVPGATHGLGVVTLLWQCYDAGTPVAAISPGSVSVQPGSGDVLVQWAAPQAGTLALIAVPEVEPLPSGEAAAAGMEFGKTVGVYTAASGAAVLGTGAGLLPAKVRIHGVTCEVLTTFGATQGLTTLAVGGLGLTNGWGSGIARTAGTLSTLEETWRTDLPITGAAADVTLSPDSGLFDATGEARLTVHWSRLVPD